jgi:hypothetical protein
VVLIRRILRVMTMALVMAAMMAVMAGTASAKATFINPCLLPPEAEREELGTVAIVPGGGPQGDNIVCTGKPFAL